MLSAVTVSKSILKNSKKINHLSQMDILISGCLFLILKDLIHEVNIFKSAASEYMTICYDTTELGKQI